MRILPLALGIFTLLTVWMGPRLRSAAHSFYGHMLLTAMHMTLLGALLALSPRPLYAHAHSLSGLAPLEDQHLGGAIMLIVGGASYLAGGVWLATRLLGSSKKAV